MGFRSSATSSQGEVVTRVRGNSVHKPEIPLAQRWAVTIPGTNAHVFASDPHPESIAVSDGWAIPYAALRLHCLNAATGKETAALRTRHQSVTGLRFDGSRLFAATDSRLFELEAPALNMGRMWERGLVRYSSQIEVSGGYIVLANWLKPTIAILDTRSGRIRRLRTGSQPVLFQHDGHVRVVSALEGGMHTVDVERGRLVEPVGLPPLSAVAVGGDVWGIVAGEIESPRVSGPLPGDAVLPRYRRGTGELRRITGRPLSVRISGRFKHIWCDDSQGVLWCLVEGPTPPGAVISVYAVSQASGLVVAEFHSETQASLRLLDPELGIVPVHIAHLDPDLGLMLTTQDYSRRMRGSFVLSSESTLTAYSLPTV